MKSINVWFDDVEHKYFTDLKEHLGLNWHDFLLDLLKTKEESIEESIENE